MQRKRRAAHLAEWRQKNSLKYDHCELLDAAKALVRTRRKVSDQTTHESTYTSAQVGACTPSLPGLGG
jgi:hypothetical protein